MHILFPHKFHLSKYQVQVALDDGQLTSQFPVELGIFSTRRCHNRFELGMVQTVHAITKI